MTDALIVLAHPGKSSLSRLFADDVEALLASRQISVDRLDLYQEQFSAPLTQRERAAYYETKPELTDIDDHAQRLLRADTLVLIFPTWWFGLPAILKGWIDRTFAPTIAFDHASNFGPIIPRLTRLKAILIITTLGAPWWVDWFVMRRPVRRILKTAIFGLCAPQAKFEMLSLYSAEKPNKRNLDEFRHKLAQSKILLESISKLDGTSSG
jgi:NAD(P)H dehydrogenase (quinone)